MRNTNNNNNNSPEDQRKKESTLTSLDSRFNQTLRNVQGLLKGCSIPGKILLTRRSDPLDESSVQERTPEYERSLSYNEAGSSDRLAKAAEEEVQSTSKPNNNTNVIKFSKSYEVHKGTFWDNSHISLLKGRSIPGKILLTRRSDPLDESSVQERTPEYERSLSYNEAGSSDRLAKAAEEEVQSTSKPNNNTNVIKLKTSTSEIENTSKEVQKSAMGARATDSARVMKFTKALSGTTVILEKLRELAWSGIPDYMRPDVWRLLLERTSAFIKRADKQGSTPPHYAAYFS
nr:hypothetical protein CFP56_42031 [Quercus suber]